MYENAQYYTDINNQRVGIRFDLNGVTFYVPLDPTNTDYAAIMQLVADGKLTIGAE
jgi:hypothetical protein